MKTSRALTIFAAALTLAGVSAAQPFVSHPITIPGGSNVLVTGINDSGEMVANYTDTAGTAHCVAIVGAAMVQIVDPNEIGTGPGKGTSCWGINNSGQIVGSYSLAVWGNGFAWTGAQYVDIGYPGATAGTIAYGLNNVGQIVGSYADNGGQHGFLYYVPSATWGSFDLPGATATLAIGINDFGTITFEWVNASFVYSGAILKGGNYTILNVPGMAQSKARGINLRGQIVMNCQDSAGVWHGFLYTGGRFVEFNATGAANTYSFGINKSAQVVGGFNPTRNATAEVGFEGRF